MYYCYTTILGKSEEEFWQATPAKVFKQLDIHKEIISSQVKNKNSNKNTNELRSETVRLKVNK
ncbi:MAG: hypothetical protein MJH09_13485 [Cetobacterium sp.]|nr:hypothetical protein [Cetobacterium sp.]